MKRSFTNLFILLFLSLFSANALFGQDSKLKPGFDKEEFLEVLRVIAKQVDTSYSKIATPAPEHCRMIYRSPVIGLDNRYDLWIDENNIVIVSIRGTTGKPVSWLENFYAAMVPALGTLQIAKDFNFNYHFSDNPAAAVHTGWLIGTAFIARDFLGKIDSLYATGHHDFIIAGHSQGGSIAYMLTSHLNQLQNDGKINKDVRFKTYCSAAPKPGNLFYAYSFEHITQGGWAFHVINTADWVPEVPISIQTFEDFSKVNPFTDAKNIIGKLKFPKDVVLRYVYNRLNNMTKKAGKKYEKYLGMKVYKSVLKVLPDFEEPEYANTNNYVRTGSPIVLYADEEYYKEYPVDPDKLFEHHFTSPYYFLTKRLPDIN
nr:lipase family protein [Bacteroidota bacterium]